MSEKTHGVVGSRMVMMVQGQRKFKWGERLIERLIDAGDKFTGFHSEQRSTHAILRDRLVAAGSEFPAQWMDVEGNFNRRLFVVPFR